MAAIKKTKLYSSLWASCDELRGGMDASQYKDYILTLLFVKYVSDKYKGDPDALIVIPKGGSFDDIIALKGNKNIGEEIDKIIAKLASENGLTGIIDNAKFNDTSKLGQGKEMSDKLTNIVGIFQGSGLDFKNNRADGDDIIGDAYEYLMRHFATEAGKSKGSFYTPAEVSRVLAKIVGITNVNPKNEISVYDPACGSGSLLIKVADEAPPCTYLYIDKSMRDHGLFQAICRVNRLDGEDKDFGFIVDYKELFGELNDAVANYTAENPFSEYDKDDIDGILKQNAEESRKYFESVMEELETLCEGVKQPRKELEYIQYFCGANGVDTGKDETFSRIRESLYKLTGRLTRAFAEFKGKMSEVGYNTQEQAKAEGKVRFYIELRETIGNASGDFIDFKRYEPGMRFLIDNYIAADSSQKIGGFDDFTLLDFIILNKDKVESDNQNAKESAAEAIENNIRKRIIEKKIINPFYYEKMSEVLERLIAERRNGTLAYKDLIAKYIELASNVSKPEQNPAYPATIKNSEAKRMFFDNFGHNEMRANALYDAVMENKMDGFRENLVKERMIRRAIRKILDNDAEVDAAFDLICAQEEF